MSRMPWRSCALHQLTTSGVQDVNSLITCDVNFGHLVKVVFAIFLYSKAIIFPIIMNKYCKACEILLDYAKILFLLNLSPTNFSIWW